MQHDRNAPSTNKRPRIQSGLSDKRPRIQSGLDGETTVENLLGKLLMRTLWQHVGTLEKPLTLSNTRCNLNLLTNGLEFNL